MTLRINQPHQNNQYLPKMTAFWSKVSPSLNDNLLEIS